MVSILTVNILTVNGHTAVPGRKPVSASNCAGTHAPTSRIPSVHRVPAHLARRFHQICLGVLAEVTEMENLTPVQYAVLAAVHDEPGLDQRGLARRLAIDAVTAGQLVDALENQQLIDRKVHPEDRRARVLNLTPAGLELRLRLRPALAAAHAHILAPLKKKEQEMLLSLLTRVVEGNEAYARPGNGRRRPRRQSSAANKEERV